MTADAAYCRRLTLAHARTFGLASVLLPPARRRGAYAIYAFCRTADDLVDEPAAPGTDRRAALGALGASFERTLAGDADGPVMRELGWTIDTFGIPPQPFRELLSGVGRDLDSVRIAGWDELAAYCEGVASSVGEMCAHVFGLPDDREARRGAVRYARTLGVALQLTNILRDVGEDARLGRCYLPDEDLRRFGLTREEVLGDPLIGRDERWRPLMALLIGRARSLYEAARPGFDLLAPESRGAARACAVGYAGILGAVERLDYDTITTRATLALPARMTLLWQAWRSGPAPSRPRSAPQLPDAVRHAQRTELAHPLA